MTDKELNEYINFLLDVPKKKRTAAGGRWTETFECALAMWDDRHPGTRAPAFAKLGPPPACFSGKLPPIYEGELK